MYSIVFQGWRAETFGFFTHTSHKSSDVSDKQQRVGTAEL